MPPPARTRVVEVPAHRLEGWLERFAANNPDGPQRVLDLERFDHDPLAVVLIRRGGYAVGIGHAGRLTRHSTGTRYVQSRTAAGGWSQQRFARRRANQADALVGAAVDKVLRVLGEDPGAAPEGLVVGGDRALVAEVLADARLRDLAALPRREFYDLPDPRLVVLEKALERGHAVRVTISE